MEKKKLVFIFGVMLLVIILAYSMINHSFNPVSNKPNNNTITGNLVFKAKASTDLTKEKVLKALEEVEDPERLVSIVKVLNIKNEDVQVETGSVQIRLDIPSYCPMKMELISLVEDKLRSINEVRDVIIIDSKGVLLNGNNTALTNNVLVLIEEKKIDEANEEMINEESLDRGYGLRSLKNESERNKGY